MPAMLLLMALGAGASGSEHMVYDLAAGGQRVGVREVTVRHLDDGPGGRGLVQAWTELAVPAGGRKLVLRQRLVGIAGGGFSASIDQDGDLRSIQVVRRDDEWVLTVAEHGEASIYHLVPGAFDATSIDLMAPGRAAPFEGLDRLRVLSAETGGVIEGAIADLGPSTVDCGGVPVAGEAWGWSVDGGQVRLVYDSSGRLLSYDTRIAGRELTATLAAPPAPPDYGEDLGFRIGGPVVHEDPVPAGP